MEDRPEESKSRIEEQPNSIFTFFKDEWKDDLLSFEQLSFGKIKCIDQVSRVEDHEQWEIEVLQQLSFAPNFVRKNSFTVLTKGKEHLEYIGKKRDLSEFHTKSMIDIGEERHFKEKDLNSKLKHNFKDPLNDSIDKAIAHSTSLSIEPSLKKIKEKSQCFVSFKRISRRKSLFSDNIINLFK